MSQHSDQHAMYGHRAAHYDAIYHWKAYDKDAMRLHALLQSEGITDGSKIIEAACGTGSYLIHLKQWYNISGFDISEDMLRIARARLPGLGVNLFRADMCDFRLQQPADALLCLFSSIGYLYPLERLQAAARSFAGAVRPGGIVIVEPWVAPENFIEGRPWMDTFGTDDLKLCRTVISRRAGDMAVLDFHWLAAKRGEPEVEYFVDRHAMWLCPRQMLLDVFQAAGFQCRFEEDGLMKGRGLLIGRRAP